MNEDEVREWAEAEARRERRKRSAQQAISETVLDIKESVAISSELWTYDEMFSLAAVRGHQLTSATIREDLVRILNPYGQSCGPQSQ